MSNTDFNIKEIQSKLLEILLYFDKFCKDNNLKYTLAGGTILGAVRHKGFIPWDDDLDIFMLREDYEKLYSIWNNKADTERYGIIRSDDKVNIHHSVIEIQDKNTTFVVDRNVDLEDYQGLMIDIIPLDGVAPSKFGKIFQMMSSMIYCCFNFQRIPTHKSGLTVKATKIALSIVRSFKMRYNIWKWAEKRVKKYGTEKSELVASFVEGATIMRQRFPTEWFENPEYLEFEQQSLPVPKDYDKWLTVSYGDYMQLPPEEDRVFRHGAVFVDLNTPYKEYHDVYYGKNRTVK